jgi:hypothetical protein
MGRAAVTCKLCGQEMCDRCTEMFHASVTHWRPTLYGGTYNREHVMHNGRYCPDCSVKVVRQLRLLGLIESVDKRTGAVMDGRYGQEES